MKKILLFGTFDIVHLGHLHMFKEAKEYAEKLVVVVARDTNVEKIKGECPFHSENERVEFLKNIKLIDDVLLGDKKDPYKIINEIKPDIIGLGYDQKVYIDNLAEAISNFGLEIRIVRFGPHNTKKFKSSRMKKYVGMVT